MRPRRSHRRRRVIRGRATSDPSACDPSEPVTAVEIHGTGDTVIRYDGGRNRGNDPNAPAYPSAEETTQMWVGLDECSPTPTTPDPATRDLEPASPLPPSRRSGHAPRARRCSCGPSPTVCTCPYRATRSPSRWSTSCWPTPSPERSTPVRESAEQTDLLRQLCCGDREPCAPRGFAYCAGWITRWPR